ncbi:TIGR02302 family protein [Limimonas halophila]|uniref:TIGR02302 family protein n=1 Tax=Limimonas halophila TaxID=1082479 RepID=A0A1G7U2X4_9PROT|nr:TIGR02302 family protein [Limimonas halophila]SDG41777.1 TIGR02302 family protein [Limimonas halophila]
MRRAPRRSDQAPQPCGLRRHLVLGFLAILWERAWPRLWPAASVAALLLAVGLSGALPLLPGWAHLLVLALGGAAVAGLLVAGLWRVRPPDGHTVRRRVERDSALRHRPLTSEDETLAAGTGDPMAEALWTAHRERLRASLKALRVRLPRPGVAARDPAAVRAIPLLLLVAGLIAAGPRIPERLAAAVSPAFGAPAPERTVNLWVDPPGYTGQAPRVLTPGPDAARVPDGSRLVAQVHGGTEPPTLQVAGSKKELAASAERSWKLTTEISQAASGPVRVRAGGDTLARWELAVLADAPPSVAFARAPRATPRGALQVRYEASDDYGVTSVRLRISRPGSDREPIVRELPAPGDDEGVSEAYENLGAHIWAGLPVRMTLIARDAAGQTAESETIRAPLPARRFEHPVARQLVELRRELAREPETRAPVVRALNAIGNKPGRYDGDYVVSLAVRAAERRLVHDQTRQAVREVQRILWETALHLEEGTAALAARDLERAREALERALRDEDASAEEIARLTEQLQAAMQRYLQAKAREMQQAEEAPRPQQDGEMRMIQGDELQKLTKRIQQLAQAGQTERAQKLLDQLRQIMEGLQQRQPSQMSERAREAQKAMQALRELSREQQELLDRTYRRSQQQQQQQGQAQQQSGQQQSGQQQAGQQQGGQQANRQGAQRQGELRQQLGELAEKLGKTLGQTPQALGQAGERMGAARQSLERGEPGQAVPSQREALNELQKGLQQAGQRARQMMQAGRGGQGRRDPLGRSRNGAQSGADVQVPEEMDVQRAREILQQLRGRAGDRSLPELDREYIDRLLDRF